MRVDWHGVPEYRGLIVARSLEQRCEEAVAAGIDPWTVIWEVRDQCIELDLNRDPVHRPLQPKLFVPWVAPYRLSSGHSPTCICGCHEIDRLGRPPVCGCHVVGLHKVET